MLGFSALFLGDYRVWPRSHRAEFKTAVEQAKTRRPSTGAEFKTDFDTAKGELDGQVRRGQDAGRRRRRPRPTGPPFLKTISEAPARPGPRLQARPERPRGPRPHARQLRVHIDADQAGLARRRRRRAGSTTPTPSSEQSKDLDAPATTATTRPTGEGWIIQIVGHHYNPYPSDEDRPRRTRSRSRSAPRSSSSEILPRFWTPELRLYGIHHVALTWMPTPDRSWTTEKAARPATCWPRCSPPESPPRPATGAAGGRPPRPARRRAPA